MSALEGYPQTHQSPEIIHVVTQHDTNKYEGPYLPNLFYTLIKQIMMLVQDIQ